MFPMKWIGFFLVLLLPFSTAAAQAWLQITDEANIQTGTPYVLTNTPNVQEETVFAGAINKSKSCLSEENTPFYWYFEKLANGYRVYYYQNSSKIYLTNGSSTELKVGNSDDRWIVSFSEDDHAVMLSSKASDENRFIMYSPEYQYFKYYTPTSADVQKIYLQEMVDLPAPEIIEASEYFYPEMQVNIQTSQKDCEIHYTTDGTNPTAQSPLYTGSITITKTTTIKAVSIYKQAVSQITAKTFYLAPPITVRFGGNYHLGTFCAPYSTQMPDGMTAYYITGIQYDKLQLQTYPGNILPAYTPFILQDKTASEAILTYTTQQAERPSYDSSLVMGTCEETEVKNGQQIYALGYNEKDPTEFGFCRYVGTQLAANKAYLVFTQKYILKESDLQPGQYTFVLATEKDANNQPQGIAWGTYNSSNKRINKTNISDTATPTEWQFQVTDDNLVTIENGSYKLAVLKEYGEPSLYDYNRQNTKSDYLDDWTLTYQPETSKFRIGVSQFPDRSISYDDVYGYIKFYQRTENDSYQDFYLFEVNQQSGTSTMVTAPFFSISLPEISGLPVPTTEKNNTKGIYSIDGRKRSNPQKGYNIINGKVIYQQ